MAEARMAQSCWWSCPGEMGDPCSLRSSHSIGFCLVTCAITKCALRVCSPLGPSEDRGQKSWPQLWGDGWATWATCVTELTAKAKLLWHRNAFPYQSEDFQVWILCALQQGLFTWLFLCLTSSQMKITPRLVWVGRVRKQLPWCDLFKQVWVCSSKESWKTSDDGIFWGI